MLTQGGSQRCSPKELSRKVRLHTGGKRETHQCKACCIKALDSALEAAVVLMVPPELG